jgi:AcrR family transcriptional regulator
MQAMPNSHRKIAPAATRASRQDGDATRAQLLDVAGQVFAERGFADATSKEICTRANTNMAAVNYHFGSRDQLYEAVLVEAHSHMITLDSVQAAASMPIPPRDKLGLVIRGIVRTVTSADAHWGPTVVIRELLAPTPFAPTLVEKAIAPKAKVMIGIVGEILGLTPVSPGLQRSLMFLMGSCLSMIMAPRGIKQALFPALASDPDALADDLLCYTLAGLDAIRAKYTMQ